jgi:hypothetical protein
VSHHRVHAWKKRVSLVALALSITAMATSAAQAAFERCTPAAVLAATGTVTPAPANTIGCNEGLSIKLSNGDSVWRCSRTWDGSKVTAGKLMLVAADGTISVLPDTTTRTGFGQFSIWEIDLDGDGSREQIFSAWNGRGPAPVRQNSWTSIIFRANWAPLDGDTSTASRSMAGASDIHDWGLGNLILDPDNRQNCLIALSEYKKRENVLGLQVDYYELGTASLRKTITTQTEFWPWTSAFRSQRAKTLRRTPYSGDVLSWISTPDASK